MATLVSTSKAHVNTAVVAAKNVLTTKSAKMEPVKSIVLALTKKSVTKHVSTSKTARQTVAIVAKHVQQSNSAMAEPVNAPTQTKRFVAIPVSIQTTPHNTVENVVMPVNKVNSVRVVSVNCVSQVENKKSVENPAVTMQKVSSATKPIAYVSTSKPANNTVEN
mgnify:CR=1 FL=1